MEYGLKVLYLNPILSAIRLCWFDVLRIEKCVLKKVIHLYNHCKDNFLHVKNH